MRFFLFSLTILALMTACQSNQKPQPVSLPAGTHMMVAQEVIQATQYTYIRGTENEKEVWVALPLMPDAKVGTTYYFDNAMEMSNFVSKDLNRTFAQIFFINAVKTSLTPAEAPVTTQDTSRKPGKVAIEKKEVKVEAIAGGVTIAKLYAAKGDYAGKVVKIKGEVTKYNSAIMNKNWIHLQDGSDFQGKFDLTVTTDQEVKVGDVVTLEGKIVLDQDFGYGYKYEILLSDAKVVKK
ncbi:MAG: hypothetical protein WCO63_02085 [Bacteroidota bacterium]